MKVFPVEQWTNMLPTLILFSLLFKASTAQITGHGNSEADNGGKAHFRCAMANPAGVLQVTWQRLFKDESIENLATYSKRFGLLVNEPYRGKIIFTEASLSSTSITLTNVTWADESCYICSFNVYPDGSRRRQTCLTVKGISEVTTEVASSRPEGEEELVKAVVFSCSATGKPAPTIEWDSPGAIRSNLPQTTTVSNIDRTFTSSSNLTLLLSLDWKGHVDCVLNSGMAGQRRERMNFTMQAEDRTNTDAKGGKAQSRSGTALTVSVVIIISLIVAGAVLLRRRLKDKRRNENV